MMQWLSGLCMTLALILLMPLSGFAAWQLVSVSLKGTTYTVTLRDPGLYQAPAEGEKLPTDPLLSGEHVWTSVYDGSIAVAAFESNMKREIARLLDNLNRQITAKEAIQKDVTPRFK